MNEQNKEREAFEAWAKGEVDSLKKGNNGGYLYADATLAWKAWQASATLVPAAPVAQGLPDLTDERIAIFLGRFVDPWMHQGAEAQLRAILAKAAPSAASGPLINEGTKAAAAPSASAQQAEPDAFEEARKAYVALTNAVAFEGDRARYIASQTILDCFDRLFGAPAPSASTKCDGTVGKCPNECSSPCSSSASPAALTDAIKAMRKPKAPDGAAYAEYDKGYNKALSHVLERLSASPADTAEEDAYVIDRLGKLLAGVAIALKGPDLAQHRHSYHDLVEVAEKMVIELELYRAIYGDKIPAEPSASPAALTDYSYQQLFDAISAATKVTSGTEHISISVDAFRAAILAQSAPRADQSGEGAEMVARKCTRCDYIGRCDCEPSASPETMVHYGGGETPISMVDDAAPSASAQQAEPIYQYRHLNEVGELMSDAWMDCEADEYATMAQWPEIERRIVYAAPAPASPAALTDEVRNAIEQVEGALELFEPEDADAFQRVKAALLAAAPAAPHQPMQLPESMSRDEMLAYYSQYANVQANEALQYQKRIRELEAQLGAPPAALTDYSYQQLFDAISAATKVTSGTEHISISVDAFRAALLAASPADQGEDARTRNSCGGLSRDSRMPMR